MSLQESRREFLRIVPALAGGSLVLGRLPSAAAEAPAQRVDPPKLTVISGDPGERGHQYGRLFRQEVQSFLDREIYARFAGHPDSKDKLLSYAGACGKAIREYSPVAHSELVGIAAGAGIRPEEAVLITLHEELGHAKDVKKIEHCTAVAVGPPDTRDGHTYVGQSWDWMKSVAGLSSMLLWKRADGPSVLAYAYPGLWVGAGMNSSGIALCWTSAAFKQEASGPRVGIPSYVLLTHLLYQNSLEEIKREARRATAAGWFTFVLGDSRGNLLNIEGSPQEIAIEEHRGRLARVMYGSRQMTKTPAGAQPKFYPRCEKMYQLLGNKNNDAAALKNYFSDRQAGICVGDSTLDMMIFDTTAREALVSRGPSYSPNWQRFGFEGVITRQSSADARQAAG